MMTVAKSTPPRPDKTKLKVEMDTSFYQSKTKPEMLKILRTPVCVYRLFLMPAVGILCIVRAHTHRILQKELRRLGSFYNNFNQSNLDTTVQRAYNCKGSNSCINKSVRTITVLSHVCRVDRNPVGPRPVIVFP